MLTTTPTTAPAPKITTERLLSAQASPARDNAPVFRLITRNDDRINGSIPSWGPPQSGEEKVAQTLASSTSKLTPDTGMALSLNEQAAQPPKDDGFGFFDFVDMINPLQHIPIVGTIYRSLTGDEIKPVSQIVGGAVFGGPIGAAGGIANAVVSSSTGRDIGGNAMAFVMGDDSVPKTSTTASTASIAYRRSRYND